MQVALEEARSAASAGDIPVGAIVATQNGRILARSGNKVERNTDPSAHAEVLVLREAAQAAGSPRLVNCVLVVTLEPCLMCLGAAAHARIDGIVYGAADARAGAVISRTDPIELPLSASLWHMGGILASHSMQLLSEFFTKRR